MTVIHGGALNGVLLMAILAGHVSAGWLQRKDLRSCKKDKHCQEQGLGYCMQGKCHLMLEEGSFCNNSVDCASYWWHGEEACSAKCGAVAYQSLHATRTAENDDDSDEGNEKKPSIWPTGLCCRGIPDGGACHMPKSFRPFSSGKQKLSKDPSAVHSAAHFAINGKGFRWGCGLKSRCGMVTKSISSYSFRCMAIGAHWSAIWPVLILSGVALFLFALRYYNWYMARSEPEWQLFTGKPIAQIIATVQNHSSSQVKGHRIPAWIFDLLYTFIWISLVRVNLTLFVLIYCGLQIAEATAVRLALPSSCKQRFSAILLTISWITLLTGITMAVSRTDGLEFPLNYARLRALHRHQHSMQLFLAVCMTASLFAYVIIKVVRANQCILPKDALREASNTLNNSGTEERNAATDALAPLVKASSKPLLHSHFDGLFRFDCLLIAPDNKFINSFLLPLAYGVLNGVHLVFAVLYSKALLVYLLGLAMGHESTIFELGHAGLLVWAIQCQLLRVYWKEQSMTVSASRVQYAMSLVFGICASQILGLFSLAEMVNCSRDVFYWVGIALCILACCIGMI